MAQSFVPFWVLILFLSNPASSDGVELLFNGFGGLSYAYISLDGNADIEPNGILKLTNNSQRILGSAFYSSPIRFRNSTTSEAFSFSTAFAFSIHPGYRDFGGHGLAFVISKSKDFRNALPSQYLGIFNSTNVGSPLNHIFAVEFDTIQDIESRDIDDNHVGIDINSVVSNKSVPAAYYEGQNSTKKELNLNSGKVIWTWIKYDADKNQVTVKLSPTSELPKTSLLTFDVNLSPIFEDEMYVGFSASTGFLVSSHYVFGWSFKMNGDAKTPLFPMPKKTHNTGFKVGVSVAAAALVIMISGILGFYTVKKIKKQEVIEAWELDIGPHRYPYNELKQATLGFREKNVIGVGGFGKVYKGTLPNSDTQVAVKRISPESRQGQQEFVSEIATIGRLRHRNLVQLLGWCRKESDFLLVYDFMPNGSLDKYLFKNPEKILSWEERFKIIKGVASGLLYLHEGWEQTVIHRDKKAGNVLLDAEMNGRLGDFGLAKLYEHGSNPVTTKVMGTFGYLAPELPITGKPTPSSDVFAFGALLLEVVCGRRPVEPKAPPGGVILVEWVRDKWGAGVVLDVVDSRLGGDFDESEVVVVLKLGITCSSIVPKARPIMRQVVRYLEGEAALPDELVSSGAYGRTEGNDDGSSTGGEFEDYVHSWTYQTSSLGEKSSNRSS